LLQTENPLAKLRELYRQRDPLYREVADIVVDTGRQSVAGMTRVLFGKIELLQTGLAEPGVLGDAG
jgi:shikimate kinase